MKQYSTSTKPGADHGNQVFCSESPLRSMAKAMAWRILASITTFIISYVVTHEVYVSGIIASTDVMIKLILYYMHERVWCKIKFGLQ